MIRWIQENQFEAYIAILAIFDLFLAISILANVDILAF